MAWASLYFRAFRSPVSVAGDSFLGDARSTKAADRRLPDLFLEQHEFGSSKTDGIGVRARMRLMLDPR